MENRTGFTLIEVLVVVLIIAVLAAVAVPQYQKAVLKSRFSSLMPTTKAIRDGNEAYYMMHGGYARLLSDLDVTTTDNEDMTLELSDDLDYAYTLSTREDMNNNLLMYQKNSVQFPGEIHCEALQTNKLANWLCEKGMQGRKISGSVVGGYNTYIIEGAGNGLFGANSLIVSCDKANSMGYTCTLTKDENGKVTRKQVCTKEGVCSIVDYNDDGSHKLTTCQLNAKKVCNSKRERYYNEDGNLILDRTCKKVNNKGVCTTYNGGGTYYEYDEYGNNTSKLYCKTVDSNNACTEYESWREDYAYDDDGHKTSKRYCATTDENGKCTAYTSIYDYKYVDGKIVSQRYCNSAGTDGKCAQYGTYAAHDYTYDTDGNQTAQLYCKTLNASGGCTAYNNGVYYGYDENGNQIWKKSCSKINVSTKQCTTWSTSGGYNYGYDEDGNQTTVRSCTGMDNTGKCTGYSYGFDNAYDNEGHQISHRQCAAAGSVDSNGKCTAYDYGTETMYDDDGRAIATKTCKTWDGLTCTAWKTPTFS